MAGTIICDYIRTDANQLSLNVGNTTFATINASGFFSNTGTQLIAANGKISGASVISGSIPGSALSTAANTIPRSSMTSGSVLQVVNGTVNYVTTTSASLVDTGLTASITPTSSSSKILVSVNLVSINPAVGGAVNWAFVLTDGSNSTIQNLINYNASAGSSTLQSPAYSLLLSPATTSSITYKVRFSISGGNTLRLGDYSANFNPSTITLMEIAA